MVDACIRESQRLYPVAPFVVRHLASDLRLKDGEECSQKNIRGIDGSLWYAFFFLVSTLFPGRAARTCLGTANCAKFA